MSARAPLDLDYCIRHSAGQTGVFGQHYTSVTPVMADHAQDFIMNLPRDPELARVHLFEYLATANELTNEACVFDFRIHFPTIPELDAMDTEDLENLQIEWPTNFELDEVDMEVLAVKIRSTRFDMGNIQDKLFGGPLMFTHQQKWDLATIIIDHQREDWRVRAVAIMMTKHARLGEHSRLSNLEPEIMGIITKMALL